MLIISICGDRILQHENDSNKIIQVETMPVYAMLDGISLDLNPDDLDAVLPNSYYHEFDYGAFAFYMKYAMSDMPVSVVFEMPDAVSEASNIKSILDARMCRMISQEQEGGCGRPLALSINARKTRYARREAKMLR